MLSGDPLLPPLASLTTEQIQKYLEENKELILAILEGQNLGKFTEITQCKAKLQHNLTYLAKLADAQPQFVVQQGQGMQHTHEALSQQQPDLPALNLPFDKNNQQQQQHHLAMSLQQPDLSTSNLPFQLNDQQQQLCKQPVFFQRQQQQLIQGPMSSFHGTNSGIYSASQTRLGINLSDTPGSNQIGLDATPGWPLGKSSFGRTSGNTRP